MFNRKRHSSAVHLPKQNAQSQSSGQAPTVAASAAAQAFLKSSQSTASLSSAAAAAALKSYPASPTNPADLQTKRMVRKNSTGSTGGAAPLTLRQHTQHKRGGSVGGLLDRSLRSRSPSPARSILGSFRKSSNHVPPVPYIPTRVNDGQGVSTTTLRPRAASVGVPTRTYAPVIPEGTGRGSSTDRGGRRPLQQSPRSSPPRPMESLREDSGEGNRRNVNFSRPISPPQSPNIEISPPRLIQPDDPAAKYKKQQSSWLTSMPGGELRGSRPKQRVVSDPFQGGTNNQSSPTSSKRDSWGSSFRNINDRGSVPAGLSASKWSHPYMHAGTLPFDPHVNEGSISPPPEPHTAPSSRPQTSYSMQGSEPDHSSLRGTEPPSPVQSEPSQALPLQISEADPAAVHSSYTPSPLEKSIHAVRPLGDAFQPQKQSSFVKEQQRSSIDIYRSESPHILAPKPLPVDISSRSRGVDDGPTSPSHIRNRSLSPQTVTILSAPQLPGNRHEPLQRTASPIKSAMKQPNRTSSPAVVTEKVIQPQSLEVKKKKSVRITLDVRPDDEVNGISTKYAPPTPMKPIFAQALDENYDDIMTPRPELPSFGSIRDQSKKSEIVVDKKPQTDHLEDSMPSSDHIIGGILRQTPLAGKGARREDAETAKSSVQDPNEPLPPDVTSVEGTGFDSNSDDGSMGTDTAPEPNTLEPVKVQEVALDSATGEPAQIPKADSTDSNAHPQSIDPVVKSQALVQKERALQVPGAFPDEEEEEEQEVEHHVQVSHPPKLTASALKSIAEDDHESSDDNSSIYSDAEEELDGTGFASLDAVMEHSTPKAIARAQKDINEDSPIRTSHNFDFGQDLQAPDVPEPVGVSGTIEALAIEMPPPTVDPVLKEEDRIWLQEEAVKSPEQPAIVPDTRIERVTTPEPPLGPGLGVSRWSPAVKFHAAVDQIKALRRNSAQSPTRLAKEKTRSPTRKAHPPPQSQAQTQAPITRRQQQLPQPAGSIVMPLERTDSAGSASSFKRYRASSHSPSGNRRALRSSMRQADTRAVSPPQGLASPQKRTLSPAESMSSQPHSMRTSLRGGTGPTRQQSPRQKPNRLSSFMKTSKSKAGWSSDAPSGKGNSTFTSRYAHDSDSDDGAVRKTYSSRFAQDSDDEDYVAPSRSPPPLKAPASPRASAPAPYAQQNVRGIPRRMMMNDNDSTDLEGESPSPPRRLSPQIPPVPTVKDIDMAHTPTPPNGQAIPSIQPIRTGLAASRFAPPIDTRPQQRRWHSALLFGSSPNSSPTQTSSPKGGRRLIKRNVSGLSSTAPRMGDVESSTRPFSADGHDMRKRSDFGSGKRHSTADAISRLQDFEKEAKFDEDKTLVNGTDNTNDIVIAPPAPTNGAETNGLASVLLKPGAKEKKRRFGKLKMMVGLK